MRRARIVAAVVAATATVACQPTIGSSESPASGDVGSVDALQSASPQASSGPSAPSASSSTNPDDVRPSVPPVDLARFGVADVVTLPLDDWDIRVDWPQDSDGTDLAAYIDTHPGVTVLTNAGIFSRDLTPAGLLVADGTVLSELNLADGYGNFHLKPNAVFAVHDDGTASVVDSTAWDPAGVRQATQSGPALLLDGEVHPAFREGSDNLAFRSGVGVSPDGRTVYLAITHAPINLWDFAVLFRDELGVDDALYLDGQISQLWIAGWTRDPVAFLGPYVGVIAVHPR